MEMDWQERTRLLLGEEAMEKLSKAHVLVVGLGGVGAYTAEQLCRSGIGALSIVDGDQLHCTNLNRQLPALISTLGKGKAKVLGERFLDIHPNLKLNVYSEYVKDERMVEILKAEPYDYVVDAIDTLSPKIYLLYHSVGLNLSVVSAMGAGGKLDPMQLKIADISQTYACPLADALRKRLHKLGVYSGIQAVFSPEKVKEDSVLLVEEEENKKSMVGTVSYMPAIVGCMCASVVIRELCGPKIVSNLPIPTIIKRKIAIQNELK
ncbi:MAG: tRNA threonylcarbamoyladenosine dehydratase [Bacteroidales bacterium]